MSEYSKLKIVNSHLDYDHVSLIDPSSHYFLHIAVEIDEALTPFYFFESSLKKEVIKKSRIFCDTLFRQHQLTAAHVFKAILIPPGRGRYIEENKEKVHIAKFDIAILIEIDTEESLNNIQEDATFLELIKYLKENSKHLHQTVTRNVKRIGAVDHSTQGVFLFNYFYADDVEQNLEVWSYTAGWFEKETNLNNSTLFLPLEKDNADYTIINHCRWDSLANILPSLLFKRTFKTYVLDNFYANNVAAMPILYRIVT